MKKLIALFFILCFILFTITYFVLPNDNSFSTTIYVKTNVKAANRFLFNENNWIKWWPKDLPNHVAIAGKINDDNFFYSLKNETYSNIAIAVKNNQTEFNTTANLLKLNNDSIAITWSFAINQTKNPLKKINNYFYAKKLEKQSIEILTHLKSFLEKDDEVYNISIKQIMVTDTILIAKRLVSKTSPSAFVIYSLIKQLKDFIATKQVIQTNPPMLNINYDSGLFKTMVALPVNKDFKGNDSFLLKRMYPGKILVTEVKGGPIVIQNAYAQLNTYLDDYQLNSPAIPFESLITNRTIEPDSSKWITKIYYPIY